MLTDHSGVILDSEGNAVSAEALVSGDGAAPSPDDFFSPSSGNIFDENGGVVNIVDLLDPGGNVPRMPTGLNIDDFAVGSGVILDSEGNEVYVAPLLRAAGAGGGGNPQNYAIEKLNPIMTSAAAPAPYAVSQSSVWTDHPQSYGWSCFSGVYGSNLSLVTLGGVWASRSNTFDLNTGKAVNGIGEWVRIDLGSESKINIFAFFNGFSSGRVRDFKFMGSADGASWDELLAVSDMPQESGKIAVKRVFFINSEIAYRYYRLLVSGVWPNSNGFSQVGQIEMYRLIPV